MLNMASFQRGRLLHFSPFPLQHASLVWLPLHQHTQKNHHPSTPCISGVRGQFSPSFSPPHPKSRKDTFSASKLCWEPEHSTHALLPWDGGTWGLPGCFFEWKPLICTAPPNWPVLKVSSLFLSQNFHGTRGEERWKMEAGKWGSVPMVVSGGRGRRRMEEEKKKWANWMTCLTPFSTFSSSSPQVLVTEKNFPLIWGGGEGGSYYLPTQGRTKEEALCSIGWQPSFLSMGRRTTCRGMGDFHLVILIFAFLWHIFTSYT